jgi:hypothetical protein
LISCRIVLTDDHGINNNCPTTNGLLLPRDIIMDDVFIDNTISHDQSTSDDPNENYDPEDDDYLAKLKSENDVIMKRFDKKIDAFEKRIEKLHLSLNELVVLKGQQESKFTKLVNEYIQSRKDKK